MKQYDGVVTVRGNQRTLNHRIAPPEKQSVHVDDRRRMGALQRALDDLYQGSYTQKVADNYTAPTIQHAPATDAMLSGMDRMYATMGNGLPPSSLDRVTYDNSLPTNFTGAGKSKSGKTGWWTKERQQYAYDRLTKEAKLSDMGAKGLISRWSNVEATGGPTAKNKAGGAIGIGQWTGDRKKALGGATDFDAQLDHAISELNGKEKAAGDKLRNATTPQEGAIGASAYERAEGYNKSTKRDNFTNETLAGMSRVAAGPSAPAAQGGLASFFSDPLGLQAQAAEAPAGLAAFAAPEKSKQQAQIDYFGSVPTTDWSQQREEAIAQRTAQPALSDPSFNARVAANQPSAPAAPMADRFAHSLAAPLGPVSPEHYASAVPASAPARAAFDAIAAGIGAPDQSTPASNLGAQVGAMAAPQEPGMITDDKGSYAHPFGPAQFGIDAQASPMPAEASAYTEQPHTATTQAMRDSVATQPGAVAPGLSAPQDVKDYNVAAAPSPLSPNQLAPGLQASAALGLMPENTNTLQPFDKPSQFATDQTIDDPNSFPAAPGSVGIEGQTIAGDFPPAPEDSMFGPVSKATLAGLLKGGPIGGLLGAASGMFSGGLGSLGGGPAGRPSEAESYNAGSGLGGMQQGINGPRGATVYSRSNPGTFSRSRGFGLGSDLTNQYGYTTTYGPSGDIRANSGTMDAWGRVLGGLLGQDKNKSGGNRGLSQAGHDAIGKGLGGLY